MRVERRSLKATDATAGLGFPHTAHAVQVIRCRRPLHGRKRWSTETVYPITSLDATAASPADLADIIPGTGRYKTACTGSATSSSTKTAPRSTPQTVPA